MYPSRKENVQNDYIFAREENAPHERYQIEIQADLHASVLRSRLWGSYAPLRHATKRKRA